MLTISRNILILFSAGLILLLVGCGVSTEDIDATVEASLEKQVVETVNTAKPVSTTAPEPTKPSTPEPSPTEAPPTVTVTTKATELPSTATQVPPTTTPIPPTATPVPTATPKIVIQEVELDDATETSNEVSCTEFIRVNKVISTDAYEGDLVSGWEFGLKHSNGFMPHGCQIVSSDDGYPTRDGKYSLRFEVRDGDCNSNEGWNDCETDRSRHELTQVDNHKKGQDFQYEGDEYWYKWSVLMPDKPIKQGEAISFIGQFNSDNAARFYMEDFSKGVGYRFNDVDYNILEQNVLIKNEHVRSAWTDTEIHALWSSTDDGFIKIYVNEELTRTVKGPNMEGANRIWFDFGIYNAFLSRCDCKKMPTQVVYFDGIRRGASRMDVD